MSEKNRWQWLVDFPTTNGQLVFGLVLTTAVVGVPLWLMAVGLKERINETVIGMFLGATLGLSGVSTWQKVQKWKEMPESAADEPVADPNAAAPNVRTLAARPDLGVSDKGIV